MKKTIALILAILIIVVLGVGLKMNSSENLGSLYKCDFGDYDVYSKQDFFYFNTGDDHYIYTTFGVYKLKDTQDGWLLRLHNAPYEQTSHAAYVRWIDQRERNGEKITCERLNSEDDLPEFFRFFIDHHRLVFSSSQADVKELEEGDEVTTEELE